MKRRRARSRQVSFKLLRKRRRRELCGRDHQANRLRLLGQWAVPKTPIHAGNMRLCCETSLGHCSYLDPNIHGTLKPRRGTRHHTTFTLIQKRITAIADKYSLDMQNVRFHLILELKALARFRSAHQPFPYEKVLQAALSTAYKGIEMRPGQKETTR